MTFSDELFTSAKSEVQQRQHRKKQSTMELFVLTEAIRARLLSYLLRLFGHPKWRGKFCRVLVKLYEHPELRSSWPMSLQVF